MSARDAFHEAVKQALDKDGWSNVMPMTLKYGTTKLEIDLGAEQFFVAQRGTVLIAVEVKSFSSSSVVYEFHLAIGQYLNYRMVLQRLQPARIPYLAMPMEVYRKFFGAEFFQDSLAVHQINLILVEMESQGIALWLPKIENIPLDNH
jgi:XisH protein